jgi:hypothetical protein
MRRFLTASAAVAILGSAAWLGFSGLSPGNRGVFVGAVIFADDTIFTDTPTDPSLKDVLAKGLKARRPEEFAFVDRVVKMVNHGRLSREMVQSTFLWARKKSNDFPFVYFERGLKARAHEAGMNL